MTDPALELKTDLSRLVATGLERKDWTPELLAQVAGRPESAIVAVIESTHGDVSLDFVAHLLQALDMQASLVEKL
jgi:hypothetical protein